jgi:hypothetical protein
VGRPVVAGLVVWSRVVVVFSVRISGGMAHGVPIAAWCERHNSYANGWDGAESRLGAKGLWKIFQTILNDFLEESR